jgi:hypothetical protein
MVGAGTSGCRAKNRDGGALERGLSVNVRDLGRMQVRGMSLGIGVL